MFRRKKPLVMQPTPAWALDVPLCLFNGKDRWTIGDACSGTQIFGSTGSGKTTGTLAFLIQCYLKAGFGGTFLTAKPSDTPYYLKLCKQAGRLDDVFVFSPRSPFRFNALESEWKRTDRGSGNTQSIVSLLSTMLEITERGSNRHGNSDQYWRKTNRQLMRSATDVIVHSGEPLSTLTLYRLVMAAPTTFAQLHSESWRNQSYLCQCMEKADKRTTDPSHRHDLNLAADYFCLEWPGLADRTRSVILSVVTSMLDIMNRGMVREITCTESNVSPEMVDDGAIFIIDFPVKLFEEVGLLIQAQWKFCMQRALERRTVTDATRPAFIVADENHLFVVDEDQTFQTTARSSKTAVLYATQSISNYLGVLGENAEARVHSLLGNLQSQFFHQQADIKTNLYAADLIGRSRQYVFNTSTTNNSSQWFRRLMGVAESNVTAGMSEIFEYEVQPQEFADLHKGGPPDWSVSAFLYQGGRQFSDTLRPWTTVSIPQFL